MISWIEILIFMLGWTILASTGWILYLKVRRIEEKHDALIAEARVSARVDNTTD